MDNDICKYCAYRGSWGCNGKEVNNKCFRLEWYLLTDEEKQKVIDAVSKITEKM